VFLPTSYLNKNIFKLDAIYSYSLIIVEITNIGKQPSKPTKPYKRAKRNPKHQMAPVKKVFLLHFFVLIQRNEAKKNQGKPDRSARFA
jgi:hypothetical protein